MSYGYSVKLVNLNKEANGRKLGVKLGRVCIAADISVSAVARRLGVSKQTIYNWFTGVSEPSADRVAKVQAYIDKM
jgi:transcriptional regulator with XRE-family HTH domain